MSVKKPTKKQRKTKFTAAKIAEAVVLRSSRGRGKDKKPRVLSERHKESMPLPGVERPHKEGAKKPQHRTLWREIRALLQKKNIRKKAARAYVRQMTRGTNFAYMKEVLDRQEGKVPNRFADAEGQSIKTYVVGMPIEGPDAP